MKYIIFLLLASHVGLATDLGDFSASLNAYQQGQYPQSIVFLEGLLKQKDNGDLWYNLGDAYYRNRQIGRAIFSFRKAQELLPRDPDVKFNLNYLRQRTSDKVFPSSLSDWFSVSRNEWQVFLFLSTLLGWGFLFVGTFLKSLRWRRVQLGLFVIWGCALLLGAIKIIAASPFGVVTSAEADVFSGISKGDALLFKLHEGTEVSVGDASQADWVQIQLPDGKKGWLRRGDGQFSI